MQLKKRAHNGFRMCQLKIGVMTGRGREVADLMRKKKVDVLCVQKMQWKGNKAKELGDGYKLYYSRANEQGRNEVDIVMSGGLKNTMTEVQRRNDRNIRLKIRYAGEILNIVNAYAPQVGCQEKKGNF